MKKGLIKVRDMEATGPGWMQLQEGHGLAQRQSGDFLMVTWISPDSAGKQYGGANLSS